MLDWKRLAVFVVACAGIVASLVLPWWVSELGEARITITLRELEVCHLAACRSVDADGAYGVVGFATFVYGWVAVLALIGGGVVPALTGQPTRGIMYIALLVYVMFAGFAYATLDVPDAVKAILDLQVHWPLMAGLGGACLAIVGPLLLALIPSRAEVYPLTVLSDPPATAEEPAALPGARVVAAPPRGLAAVELAADAPARRPTLDDVDLAAAAPALDPRPPSPALELRPPPRAPALDLSLDEIAPAVAAAPAAPAPLDLSLDAIRPAVAAPAALDLLPAAPVDAAVELPAARPPTEPPEVIRSGLRFAVATAEIRDDGLSAVGEDGATRELRWAQIGGVLARELRGQPPLARAMLVDLVPLGERPLRFLTTSRLSFGADTSAGARDALGRLLALARAFNSQIEVEPATAAFLDRRTALPRWTAADLDRYDARYRG